MQHGLMLLITTGYFFNPLILEGIFPNGESIFSASMICALTLSLPRSSIDDLVFSVFPSNFVKLSYKISLIKNRFVTLFFIRFS